MRVRAVMTFPVIYGISPTLMEFQFEVSAHVIRLCREFCDS
jgi:hypothetical protein